MLKLFLPDWASKIVDGLFTVAEEGMLLEFLKNYPLIAFGTLGLLGIILLPIAHALPFGPTKDFDINSFYGRVALLACAFSIFVGVGGFALHAALAPIQDWHAQATQSREARRQPTGPIQVLTQPKSPGQVTGTGEGEGG